MSYTASFVPNVSYNAEAFNALGGDFMATANTSFADGTEYGVSDLNEIRSDIVTAGIAKGVGQSCSCSIVGSTIKVASGRVYFSNGIRAVIDDDGLTVAYTSGASGNVWLKYDDVLCEMSLQYTTAAPSGIYVKIATVSGGTVSDSREYCHMKNPSLLPNTVYAVNNVEISVGTVNNSTPIKTITLNKAGYKHLVVKSASTYTLAAVSAHVDFEAGTVSGACRGANNYGAEADTAKGFPVYAKAGAVTADANYLRAELTSDQLKFYVTESGGTNTVKLDLLLF